MLAIIQLPKEVSGQPEPIIASARQIRHCVYRDTGGCWGRGQTSTSPKAALELLARIQKHRATIGEHVYTGTSKTTKGLA